MDEDSVERRLWNQKITPESYGSLQQYNDHAIEQYKIYAATNDQVTAWRNSANAFFLSLHALSLTAVTLVVESGYQVRIKLLIIIPLLLAWILCYIWWRLIESYRQLNNGKFAVIKAFEERLPTSPFVEAEWKGALAEGKNPKVYLTITPKQF